MTYQMMTAELRAALIDACKGKTGPRDGDETLSHRTGEDVRICTMRPATVADILEREHLDVTSYATNGESHVLVLPDTMWGSLVGCLARKPSTMSAEAREVASQRMRTLGRRQVTA